MIEQSQPNSVSKLQNLESQLRSENRVSNVDLIELCQTQLDENKDINMEKNLLDVFKSTINSREKLEKFYSIKDWTYFVKEFRIFCSSKNDKSTIIEEDLLKKLGKSMLQLVNDKKIENLNIF